MLKKTLIRALIGFVVGMLIGDGISMLMTIGGEFIPVSASLLARCGGFWPAFLMQSLFSGIYGAITLGTISLYDIEKLPLALSSLLHCLIIVLLHIPNSLFLGWAATIWDVLIMAGIQIVSYFAIWLILWFVYRRQVKELNELQKNMQNKSKISHEEEDKT